jgi:hypothetical protein
VYIKKGTCFIQARKTFLGIKPMTGNTLYVLVLDGVEAPIPLRKQHEWRGWGGGGLPLLNVGGPDNGVFHKHCGASRFAYYFPII